MTEQAASPARRRGRRRPRPFYSSLRDDGEDYRKEIVAASGGGGGGGGGGGCGDGGVGRLNSEEGSASVENERVVRVGLIDAILERRQREGRPTPEGADACVVCEEFRGGGSEHSDAANNEGVVAEADDSGVRRVVVRAPMTDDELAAAREDVFGRPHPDLSRIRRRLAALEMEAMKLSEEEGGALERALDENPLLFQNSSHAKMLVKGKCEDEEGGGDNDDFDAVAAARRLARYWESRRSFLGDCLCYGRGVLARSKNNVDFQRYYKQTRAILDDPLSDSILREDSEMVMGVIEGRNVELLDMVLQRMEEEELVEKDSDQKYCDSENSCAEPRETSPRRLARKSPRELKIQFLNVEDMAVKRAALRLVRYWETGLRLFGPGLGRSRRVSLEDMDDCSVLLDSHMFRLMPEDDDFGRSIICRMVPCSNLATNRDGQGATSVMSEDIFEKVFWYVLHAALERDSCKRNGFVFVIDARVSQDDFKARRRIREAITNVLHCIPVRTRAVHLWFDQNTSWWRSALLRGVSYFTDVWLQRRIILHTGSMEQFLAGLGESYGIGAEKLPSDFGGSVELEYSVRWLDQRRTAGL